MQVAQIAGGRWAISARGFPQRSANKMLVLQDGRSLYTPLFGGVYWESQDLSLDDIERIEVIRGPGGTLWGANAVAGVVNIITRSAAETQSGQVDLVAGDEQVRTHFRYGMPAGSRGHLRVFAQGTAADTQATPDGDEAFDGWDQWAAGFRADWETAAGDALTLTGSATDGTFDGLGRRISLAPPFTQETPFSQTLATQHLLGTWIREGEGGRQDRWQFFLDRIDRVAFEISEDRFTADVEFQQMRRLGQRHSLVWGGGARVTTDSLGESAVIRIPDLKRDDYLYSAFIQDEIQLSEETRLIAGAKWEHNDYTGVEFQPSLRVTRRAGRGSLWASASRAIQLPARLVSETEIDVAAFPDPGGSGAVNVISVIGNPHLKAQNLHAYETGLRRCSGRGFCFDLAAFYYEMRDVTSTRTLAPEVVPGVPVRVTLPFLLENGREIEAHGVEVSANWSPVESVRVRGWYAYLDLGTPPVNPLLAPRDAFHAEHHAHLRIQVDPSPRWSIDLLGYYVGRRPYVPQPVESFTRVDANVRYRLQDSVTLSLGVQNALDDRHLEYTGEAFIVSSEIERSALARVIWAF